MVHAKISIKRIQQLALLLLIVAGPFNLFAGSTDKPNIIFLMTDDQRWDNMGCYGQRAWFSTMLFTPFPFVCPAG